MKVIKRSKVLEMVTQIAAGLCANSNTDVSNDYLKIAENLKKSLFGVEKFLKSNDIKIVDD